MNMAIYTVLVFSFMYLIGTTAKAVDPWKPTNLVHCRNNNDCNDENVCCSITPAFGKRSIRHERQVPPNWDGTVHYCLPWKTTDAPWCTLKSQYSPEAPNYFGLCPCGPGLQCTPTLDLNETYYPRDKFGKCTTV